MQSKIVTRAFNIKFPEALIPTYDFLQKQLNYILSNERWRHRIEDIPLRNTEGKKYLQGTIWSAIEDIIFEKKIEEYTEIVDGEEVLKTEKVIRNRFTEKWELGANAWYLRIILENIRRTLYSLEEKREIYKVIQQNKDASDTELREALTKANLYPTNKDLRNLKAYNSYPELPYRMRLNLDYSTSDKTNLIRSEGNKFKIRVNKRDWIDYHVVLPSSLRGSLTGKISNPRFIKRAADDHYIGICSYEVGAFEYQDKGNILGVDIGFVKQYSAIVLKEDGSYSNEYVNSKYLTNLYNKIKKLYESRERLKLKEERCKNEFYTDKSYRRHVENLNTSQKIGNLKATLMKTMASELVELAVKTDCNLIRVEDLGILRSKTGKWNYGELHKSLEELGELYGIKIEKINPKNTSKKHPLTGELGKVKGRNIVFSTGEKIDRDFLGAINIANTEKAKTTFKQKVAKFNPIKTKSKRNEKIITNRAIVVNRVKAMKKQNSQTGLNSKGQKIRVVFSTLTTPGCWVLSLSSCDVDSCVSFYRNRLTFTHL